MRKEKLDDIIELLGEQYDIQEEIIDLLVDYYSSFSHTNSIKVTKDFIDTNIHNIANFSISEQKEIITISKTHKWKHLNPEWCGYNKRTNIKKENKEEISLPDDYVFLPNGKIKYNDKLYSVDDFFDKFKEE